MPSNGHVRDIVGVPTDPSQTAEIGNTGVSVSRLGFGSAWLGIRALELSLAASDAIVERALDAGIRYFDTAPHYGAGESERRLGPALSRAPRPWVLSTKVGRLVRGDPPSVVYDLSSSAVRLSLEESLERLGLDRVDIVYIHDAEEHFEAALRVAYPVLREMRETGRIRAIGVGTNFADFPARFLREADIDCVLLAGRYTLLDQAALNELLPLCSDRGVSVVIGGVYNSGVLANPVAGAQYNYRDAPAEIVDRARRLAAVCARHDLPLMAAAIQFPFAHPAVASVLTGPGTLEELDQNLTMLRVPIPAELWHDLKAEGLIHRDAPTPAAT